MLKTQEKRRNFIRFFSAWGIKKTPNITDKKKKKRQKLIYAHEFPAYVGDTCECW